MEGIVTRKYNQRTKEWNSKIVKVDKSYEYMPLMIAKIFKLRLYDTMWITRHVSVSEDDPSRIAPTISHVPPVASKELFQLQQEKTPFTKNIKM